MEYVSSENFVSFIKRHNDKFHNGSKNTIYQLEPYYLAGMFYKGKEIVCDACKKSIFRIVNV